MPNFNQVKDFILTTEANTNKNLSSRTHTFISSPVSIAPGDYVKRSYIIPLSQETRFYQLYINYSILGGLWLSLPCYDKEYGSARIATHVTQFEDNLSLDVFLLNRSSNTQSLPEITTKVKVRDFRDEM